mgnify:CR=1 FL=1
MDEPRLGFGTRRQAGREELERDGAPELRILGLVDNAHAALPDQGDDSIAIAQQRAVYDGRYYGVARDAAAAFIAYNRGLLAKELAEFPELYRKLVTDRNRAWLPEVEALLAGDRDAMVVVGSLHLVVSEGLVELLMKRGYTVTQM